MPIHSSITFALVMAATAADPKFVDLTDEAGLGPPRLDQTVARVAFADLNGNGYPDLLVDRHLVFLNEPAGEDHGEDHGEKEFSGETPRTGRVFRELPPEETGLEPLDRQAVVALADLNNNGHLDLVVAEFIDRHNPDWIDHERRTGWHPGRGDGSFGPRVAIDTPPRPTISMAIGDVTRNGQLDLYLGNTYRQYGGGWEGEPNDLLLNDGDGSWTRVPLPEDEPAFDPETDPGGRPTFGTMILNNPVHETRGGAVMLLELNYGRRWNRAWVQDDNGDWVDIAPEIGLDGDGIRHGRHPEWLRERARTDPRFDRDDEKPFRANGNTFDAAVGDLTNDGRFDLFISEITHGWAGDSSDRTRPLFNRRDPATGEVRFVEREAYGVDRVPPAPDDPAEPHNWNQGDLFCALADLNHSGRLDLLIASGDYPDDQRLRFFFNTGEGVELAPNHWGVDHDGAQQISLADVNGNGRLDLVVGQTFRRFTPEQREGRTPRLRLFMNMAENLPPSVTLRLRGNGRDTNRDAIGAIVEIETGGRVQRAQLVGPGGHAGKQHDFLIHFGLGSDFDPSDTIDALRVIWPNRSGTVQTLRDVPPGRHVIEQDR